MLEYHSGFSSCAVITCEQLKNVMHHFSHAPISLSHIGYCKIELQPSHQIILFYIQQSVDEMKRQIEKMTMMINQALQGNNLNNNGGADAIDPAIPARNPNIIIVGGFYALGLENVSNTAETFNIVKGKSTQLPSMNIARAALASCVYNGDVIVTGGYDGKDGTDSIEILKMNQHPLRLTTFYNKLPVIFVSYLRVILGITGVKTKYPIVYMN